jgi:hypothetical protein
MNRRDAAHHLARRYPDFDALAAKMGKRPDTLRKELTGAHGYKWGVEDEELLILLSQAANVTDALAPITAAAVNANALLIPLPDVSGDVPSMQCIADSAREFSEFVASVAQAEADHRVTANELKRIERETGELVASLQRCLAHMRREHEAAKPAHVREVHRA